MTTLQVPANGWTVDDLPDDVDFRYELVDGALLVTPPPTVRHDHIASQLGYLFHKALDRRWIAVAGAGVRFDARNYRQPDLAILARGALDRPLALPEDVLLAVEIMSPSSVSNDRVTKPYQYAAAGIPHFWRLEPLDRVLVTYTLDGDVYRETGHFTDEVVIDEPVPLRFRLPDLLD